MKRILLVVITIIFIIILLYLYKDNQNIINKKYQEDNINIEYPYFGYKEIDNYINDYLNNLISNYKINERDNLFIDYDYYIKDKEVFLDIYNYETKDNLLKYNINSLNINLDNKKIIISNKKKSNYEYNILNNEVIDTNKKMIALTFDDGPSYNTSKIINILNKYNVKATFFILGSNIEGKEDIIKSLQDNEMEISSHGYSHKLLTRLDEKSIKEELSKTNTLISNITNKDINLTRPSYGSINKKVKSIINTPIITWSLDPQDWKYHNSKRIYNYIINNVKDGDIILMHDLYSATTNSLELIIPKLLDDGFQILTVSDLFYYKNIELKSHKIYNSAH